MTRLQDRGLRLGGVTAPEIREGNDRVGFRLVDVLTGEPVVMAHVDGGSGPSVGKYTVDVDAVERLCPRAFDRAIEAADCIIVDEIAPMEVASVGFVEGVTRALDAPIPVIGVIHRSDTGFIGRVKGRQDVEVLRVTPNNRDGLPRRLEGAVLAGLLDGSR